MIRVLTTLAAVLALAVTAAPASAASMEPGPSPLFVPIPYPVTGAAHPKGSADDDDTYVIIEMEKALITSYR
jgi:hypothetical protein